ncbi:hypothetical protein KUCAC02_032687, partial [Chaenocephalus aceratus]
MSECLSSRASDPNGAIAIFCFVCAWLTALGPSHPERCTFRLYPNHFSRPVVHQIGRAIGYLSLEEDSSSSFLSFSFWESLSHRAVLRFRKQDALIR